MKNAFNNVKSGDVSARSNRKVIQSVDRAVTILEAIASAGAPIALRELSAAVDLNATTTFHLVGTLVLRGLVIQDPASRQYRLGLKVVELAKSALEGLDLVKVVRPDLVNLMQSSEETVNLVTFDGTSAIYIDQVQSQRSSMLKMFTQIGTRVPLYCTGVGKAYLAHLPPEELSAALEGMEFRRFTGKTVVTPEALRTQLESVRKQGYALDDEEREVGVRCLAAPLFAGGGRVVAALSISGPAPRFTAERIRILAPMVVKAAGVISDRLRLIV